MDFGRPNAEIGWKMANGRLLFLALMYHLSTGNKNYSLLLCACVGAFNESGHSRISRNSLGSGILSTRKQLSTLIVWPVK